LGLPKKQYAIGVRRGSRTRYYYGSTLKEAMSCAGDKGLRVGEEFHYYLYERVRVTDAKRTSKTTYATLNP